MAMGRFILIGMANVAELVAGLIGERTRAGLAIAKQRGKRLGRTGAEILAPKFVPKLRPAPNRSRRCCVSFREGIIRCVGLPTS
jgi:DNA invertase Pin-like site-specific DNA recombinase